jgi:hypothetical protein
MEHTWATLDELNKGDGHYGRGKPRLLLRCEELLEMYRQEMREDDYPQEYLTQYLDVDCMHESLYNEWQTMYSRHWSDDPKHWAELDY